MSAIEQRTLAAVLCAGAGVAMASAPVGVAVHDGGALRDGERMIARCLEHAARQHYPPLSVAVIDAAGSLVAFRRQDGASPATADAALLKARTAARLQAPTSVLGEAVAADASTRDAFMIMQLTTLPGGAPVSDPGGQVRGAIGVSGSLNEQDAECARIAVDADTAPAR